jgi:hypothetical protein
MLRLMTLFPDFGYEQFRSRVHLDISGCVGTLSDPETSRNTGPNFAVSHILLLIQEVPSSIHYPKGNYQDRSFSWFSSVRPGKLWEVS